MHVQCCCFAYLNHVHDDVDVHVAVAIVTS